MSTFVDAKNTLNDINKKVHEFNEFIQAYDAGVITNSEDVPTLLILEPILEYLMDQTALNKLCVSANADDARRIDEKFNKNMKSINKHRKFLCIAALVVLGASLINLVSVLL